MHDRRVRDRPAFQVREGGRRSRRVLGLVAYLAVFATALSARVEAAAIGAAIVLGGLAFGIYLIVVQVAVIDAICQWCLASDAILALLAVLCAERLRRLAGRPHPGSGSPPMAVAS